jgi:hypothetical protein
MTMTSATTVAMAHERWMGNSSCSPEGAFTGVGVGSGARVVLAGRGSFIGALLGKKVSGATPNG